MMGSELRERSVRSPSTCNDAVKRVRRFREIRKSVLRDEFHLRNR